MSPIGSFGSNATILIRLVIVGTATDIGAFEFDADHIFDDRFELP